MTLIVRGETPERVSPSRKSLQSAELCAFCGSTQHMFCGTLLAHPDARSQRTMNIVRVLDSWHQNPRRSALKTRSSHRTAGPVGHDVEKIFRHASRGQCPCPLLAHQPFNNGRLFMG